MSILDVLRQDHQEVTRLIDDVLASNNAAERRRMFEEAATKLIAHAEAEDHVLYKPLMEKGGRGRELMMFAEEEHVLLEGLVRGLRRIDDSDAEPWRRMCTILCNALAHHVDQEETEVFPVARQVFGEAELNRMEQAFQTEKQQYMAGTRQPGGR